MYYKTILNGPKLIILDYKAREFMVTTVFTDVAFKTMINWMGQELHVDLNIFATDSQAPRAKNKIRLFKKVLQCIQSESTFTKYPKMIKNEVMECATVFIDSFDKKLGVHRVMSHRQILYKIGKLTMIYDVIRNNKTPMDQGTITIINEIGRMEEMLERIQCQDIHPESIFYELYFNHDDYDDNNSYKSDNDCKCEDTAELKDDVKKPDHYTDINDDELDGNEMKNDPNAHNDYRVDNDMKRDQST